MATTRTRPGFARLVPLVALTGLAAGTIALLARHGADVSAWSARESVSRTIRGQELRPDPDGTIRLPGPLSGTTKR